MNTPILDDGAAVVTLQHVLTKRELGMMQTIRSHEQMDDGRGPRYYGHPSRAPLSRLLVLGLLALDGDRVRTTITGAATIETLAIENDHHWNPEKEKPQ